MADAAGGLAGDTARSPRTGPAARPPGFLSRTSRSSTARRSNSERSTRGRHRGSRGERGAVTVEYAVALPTILLVLVAVLAAGGASVQQVRNQDAAAAAARVLARGDSVALAQETVTRMAGSGAALQEHRAEGWVSVSVTSSGPGPLEWLPLLRLTAEAAAPESWVAGS
ncbi:MAG: TadE family type IV pilus minor pilin [Micrococcus sp.]|nr:TadE family type IV pilus minor pilin [Micrococcus sp.]